jgi:hypothetical protein
MAPLAGPSFLFASGVGEPAGAYWARTTVLTQRPPQATAMTAKSKTNFTWVFIGLFS